MSVYSLTLKFYVHILLFDKLHLLRGKAYTNPSSIFSQPKSGTEMYDLKTTKELRKDLDAEVGDTLCPTVTFWNRKKGYLLTVIFYEGGKE